MIFRNYSAKLEKRERVRIWNRNSLIKTVCRRTRLPSEPWRAIFCVSLLGYSGSEAGGYRKDLFKLHSFKLHWIVTTFLIKNLDQTWIYLHFYFYQ